MTNNGPVFKEFKMLVGRKMANCSQKCILENECIGFELCEVDSFQMCRLTNDSPNPKPSLNDSTPCRHFMKLSHNLYSCDGFMTTDEYILRNSPIVSYSGCSHCDCVSSYTSVSGVYEIISPISLQRHDGSMDFNRTYAEYWDVFGSPFTEMLLGKEGSHVYFDLKYNDASFRYADYYDVSIGRASHQSALDFVYKMAGNANLIEFLPSGLTIPGRCEDFKASR